PGPADPGPADPGPADTDPAGPDPGDASPGGRRLRLAAQQRLLEAAGLFDASELAVLGRRIESLVAADLLEDREGDRLQAQEERAWRRRELRFTDDGHGAVHLRGRLDTESAAIVRRALDPLARPRPTDPDTPDRRSAGARTADALVEVCRRALASGDLPVQRGEPPQLVITIDADTLRSGTGAGQLDTGPRLAPGTVRRIGCDAAVTTAVLDHGGVPLALGRRERFFTPAQRRALILRDHGCAFPACDRPPAWTEAHHIRHWADEGTTDLDNGVLLCGYHHRVIHQGAWKVRTGKDRRPEFIPPAYIDPARQPIRNHYWTPQRE
ncbi:MAG: DUF222 domain-containing protein, partial [Micromonosporaceae bacterium]